MSQDTKQAPKLVGIYSRDSEFLCASCEEWERLSDDMQAGPVYADDVFFDGDTCTKCRRIVPSNEEAR